MSKEISSDNQDYSNIDTTGTSIQYSKEGKLQIILDKRVTERAFKEVLEYFYTDRVKYIIYLF
jgi:hypothetical protein